MGILGADVELKRLIVITITETRRDIHIGVLIYHVAIVTGPDKNTVDPIIYSLNLTTLL